MKTSLRFRQVHLDFHTSPHIEGIGKDFDPAAFVDRLRKARVDSITLFATCHHGWAYYDSEYVDRHPHLEFDLLRAQYDACKAAGISVPIYITAGVNNRAAELHPEWREVGADGQYLGWAKQVVDAGFHTMCFNSPYLEHLCDVIREVTTLYPDNDGIFLDIISQDQCCCKWCLADMLAAGLDPEVEEDRKYFANEVVLEKYFRETTAAARHLNPETGIFHNSGHIEIGSTRRLKSYFSHLELESLPTGGWGYDHFPMSAKYASQLPHLYLGMTGKFHTTWGEFGGFKHPNALRYECAAMMAFGARCSVGDQLHPSGQLDESTYRLIGQAYAEVEAKEPWCIEAASVSDIGVLSTFAVSGEGCEARDESAADVGAGRLLLESHQLFDVVDLEAEFDRYKVLILPDECTLNQELTERLKQYLAQGGKLILSGTSGQSEDGSSYALDIGAELEGPSPYSPDYILPEKAFCPEIASTPFVSYFPSQRLKPTTGRSLGDIHDPWFNRSYRHFCSHQHAPYRTEPSGYAAGVITRNILTFAMPIFKLYRIYGAVIVKQFFQKCLQAFVGETLSLKSNLPSEARVNLTHQAEHNRYVAHLLFASKLARGGAMQLSGGNLESEGKEIQIIEELLPLYDIDVSIKVSEKVKRVTLEPQGEAVDFTEKDGEVSLHLKKLVCHQMLALEYYTTSKKA